MKARKYSELSKELQEEHICNSICLNLAVDRLSKLTGISSAVIVAELSEISNSEVDTMSDQAVKNTIDTFDKARESMRSSSNGNANGAVFQDLNNKVKKGFRRLE